MPAFFLELFSEEIPARMQTRGAEDLARLVAEALAALAPTEARSYAGPRRIAFTATVNPGVAESRSSERGPRVSAPEQALAGFLRKHRAAQDELRQQGDFWVLERTVPGVDAASLISRALPGVLRKFPWPKSMRWGGTSRFTWVRPLRRILCILDGEVVPFDLQDGDDDGHGLASSNLTEGHRFLSPGAFPVTSEAQWVDALRARHVIVDAAERRRLAWDGIAAKADERGLTVVPDAGLLDEVAGLVEWPVPLLGKIDDGFMDLPPEVMQVSMRVNQRYFALRDGDGNAAPWFAFVANIEADDGGAAIVAGNERVLRARFSDARHFWDLDRKRTLESRVDDLKAVVFHAKLGTQYQRAMRIKRISRQLGHMMAVGDDQAETAGWLCKADLTTGMVGEFPELQGIMGGYYARLEGERIAVSDAIRDHYAPRGPDEAVPTAPVTVSVALADKLDQLVQFFAEGERPSGSGDPFALRRAALGVVRICRALEPGRMQLAAALDFAGAPGGSDLQQDLLRFIMDRLVVQARSEGIRHDVLASLIRYDDDDIAAIVERLPRFSAALAQPEGQAALHVYRRTANFLPKGPSRDWPFRPVYTAERFDDPAEAALAEAFGHGCDQIHTAMLSNDYGAAIASIASWQSPLDRFVSAVMVLDPDVEVRNNRLGLLASIRNEMNTVADFSKIEG